MKNLLRKKFGILAFTFVSMLLLSACDDESVKGLEEKGAKTFQDALEDSGLQETLQSQRDKIQEFLESNQTKQFLDNQTKILNNGIQQLGKILESNETKAILQQQMENLNEILGGNQESKNDSSPAPNEFL